MKIKTITVQKVKNLGNYNSERIEMVADLAENEDAMIAAETLKIMVEEALMINTKVQNSDPISIEF